MVDPQNLSQIAETVLKKCMKNCRYLVKIISARQQSFPGRNEFGLVIFIKKWIRNFCIDTNI